VLADLRAQLRRHPVHACDDREQHMRWAERWHRLRADTDALERRVAGKTSSIARTFDRVCDVLTGLGYLDGDEVTETGRQLARVYSESDLLVVECLRAGLWDDLAPAELASVVSALVYEHRRPDESVSREPSGAAQTALAEMARMWARLSEAEAHEKLSFLREPDLGFTWAAWRWAAGDRLEKVLDDDPDMTAGDFVRWCKQLIDLLSQIALVAGDSPVRQTARKAMDAVRRGVVAYSSTV
jgi:ATP-dependent RNA helicase HelY